MFISELTARKVIVVKQGQVCVCECVCVIAFFSARRRLNAVAKNGSLVSCTGERIEKSRENKYRQSNSWYKASKAWISDVSRGGRERERGKEREIFYV